MLGGFKGWVGGCHIVARPDFPSSLFNPPARYSDFPSLLLSLWIPSQQPLGT